MMSKLISDLNDFLLEKRKLFDGMFDKLIYSLDWDDYAEINV